jgi:NAD(P)H-nitrite reductase large subunit
MNPDDRICYCYHVSLRKLVNFVLRRKPSRPSQMSECLGAGTGCGWCIPILKRIFDRASAGNAELDVGMTPQEYAEERQTYIKSGKPKNEF